MKPSHDLFRLVKSLARSEKGYFRKYASRHVKGGENTYMTLFDAVDGQDVYDEERIKSMFGDRAFIRRLPALKNYLHALILRSLRAYYAESTESRRLRGLMDDYTTLYEKGLYDQAHKVLLRMRRLAERYDMNHYKLLAATFERRLYSVRFFADVPADAVEANLAGERETLNELLVINALETVNKRLFRRLSEHGATRGTDVGWLRTLMDEPVLHDETAVRSLPAKVLLYQIRSTGAYYLGDYDESYRNIRTLLQLLDKRPDFTALHMDVYSSLLNNLIGICILRSCPDEALEYIGRLNALPAGSYSEQVEQFTAARGQEIVLYLKFGMLDRLKALLPQLQREVREFRGDLPAYYRRYFAYYMGWGYFVLGDHTRALRYINTVLNDRSADVREDLYCFAKIINLLLHYELGSVELLRSEVLSTWRYLARRKRTYTFETLVVKFIGKAVTMSTDGALRREFIALRKELEALQSDRFESRAFDYFHFLPWLDAKIGGRAFAEVLHSHLQSHKPGNDG